MSSSQLEENRARSDSSNPSSSLDREEEEGDPEWIISIQSSLITISDSSVAIMQEDLENNLERIRDVLNNIPTIVEEAEQFDWQILPQLQQIKSLLRQYFTKCKEYAGACKSFGEYLSSNEFIAGLKLAVKQDNIQEICNYLDNIDDSLQTCNQFSAEIELQFPKISPVLTQAIASADQSMFNRRRKTIDRVTRASVSSLVVTAAVVVAGFAVDPIFTGPIALGVLGCGLLVTGIITLPVSVRYVRMKRKERAVYKNAMEALQTLDLGMHATNELIGGLRGSVDQHKSHLRLLQAARSRADSQTEEACVGERSTMSRASKDYICRKIDSLCTAMKKMAKKAAKMSRMELPPQITRVQQANTQ